MHADFDIDVQAPSTEHPAGSLLEDITANTVANGDGGAEPDPEPPAPKVVIEVKHVEKHVDPMAAMLAAMKVRQSKRRKR